MDSAPRLPGKPAPACHGGAMKRWGLAMLAALVTLGLSGCLRFTADLTVSPDDTVSGTYIVAVKDGTGESYGMSDGDFARAIWQDYPQASRLGDTSIGDWSGDSYTGIEITFADAPLANFSPTADAWGITRAGDTFVVSGPSDASAAAADATEETGGAFDGQLDELGESRILLTVTFPGNVASANGDVSGRTVTWDLQHGPEQLEATGSAVARRDNAVIVSYAVLGLLVAGGVAYGLAGRLARRSP